MWDTVKDANTAVHDTQNGTIWIDVTIPTDRSIQARRPDIILFDKTTNNTWIIDVA